MTSASGDSRRSPRFSSALGLVLCLLAGGCAASSKGVPFVGFRPNIGSAPWENPNLALPERLEQGYVLVLPGIWGDVPLDYGIVVGLKEANVPAALELYDWTVPWGMLVYNLRALDRNRQQAQHLAQRIVAYQERYPGRPVYVVGYSGGAAIAVFILEALPEDHPVSRAVLLGPTLACDYDLRPALSRTTQGIKSFYSPLDAPILGAIVTAMGTSDGRHTFAAGSVGFLAPSELKGERLAEYRQRLSQQGYRFEMILNGHPGGHFGWAGRAFVAQHLAPLISPTAEENADPQPPLATASQTQRR